MSQSNPRPRPKRLKSTIYLGREPYFHPPLSECAVVYGQLPSMEVMKKWVDDDGGEMILDVVRLGCGSTQDHLTADYATVLCGTLTEEEAAHIEVVRGEPDSKSHRDKRRDVRVFMGSGEIDVVLAPSERLKTLSLDANPSGNEMFLSVEEGGRGIPDHSHQSKLDGTAYHVNHCACQHSFCRVTELPDNLNETRSSENSGMGIDYHNPPRISSTQINNRGNDYGRKISSTLGPCGHSSQETYTIKNSDTFQQIIARELTKLAAASHVWTLKTGDSEAARLMFKEIEHFRTALSQGNLSYAVAPLDMQLNLWKISVEGPTQTPYEGGIFEIEIDIGPDWQDIKRGGRPVKSVSDIEGRSLKILTQIIHPDITDNGEARNLESIYALIGFNLDLIAKSFIDMLHCPDRVPKYLAAKPELAELAKSHPDIFDTIARHWTQEHAMGGKSSEAIVYGRLR